MTATRDRDVLNLEDASAIAKLTADSLRQAIHRGSLKARMFQGAWYVSRQHLDEYLAGRSTRIGNARRRWANERLPRKPEHISQRNWAMFRAYVREGRTYAEIAKPYGITGEAVRKTVTRVSKHLESLSQG